MTKQSDDSDRSGRFAPPFDEEKKFMTPLGGKPMFSEAELKAMLSNTVDNTETDSTKNFDENRLTDQ